MNTALRAVRSAVVRATRATATIDPRAPKRKRALVAAALALDPPLAAPKGFGVRAPTVGEPTRAFLRQFQRRAHLGVTGQFDVATLIRLGLRAAPLTVPVRAVRIIAKRFLGPIESEGNNRGPLVATVQRATELAPGPWPYCAAGVYYCLREAGWKHAAAFKAAELEAWVPGWVDAARNHRHGLSVVANPRDAREGDLVCFNWAGTFGPARDYDHIGFVRDEPVNGLLPTREFNTGPGAGGNQSDGDGCWDRLRPVNAGVLVIRVGA